MEDGDNTYLRSGRLTASHPRSLGGIAPTKTFLRALQPRRGKFCMKDPEETGEEGEKEEEEDGGRWRRGGGGKFGVCCASFPGAPARASGAAPRRRNRPAVGSTRLRAPPGRGD